MDRQQDRLFELTGRVEENSITARPNQNKKNNRCRWRHRMEHVPCVFTTADGL